MQQEFLESRSKEIISSERFQHRLLPIGGRIKAAGISLGLLYDKDHFPFRTDCSPEAAMITTRNFKALRDNPPPVIRRAYFPLERNEVKAITGNSPAVLRPILKTDQGPGGNFFGFRISDNEPLVPKQITTVGGQTIVERHMLNNIESHESHRKDLDTLLENVVYSFEQGDEYKTRLAIEAFEQMCAQLNIPTHREANKGKDSFFFIRPGLVEGDIYTVPQQLTKEIEREILNIFISFEGYFPIANDLIRRGYPPEDALSEAILKNLNLHTPPSSSLLYFQPDVIIKNDGSFIIDNINVPDVGFFLSQLSVLDGSQFNDIPQIVNELKDQVIDRIAREVKEKGSDQIVVVTRDEVVDNMEDVLEILEIETLSGALLKKGIKTEVAKISETNKIPEGSLVLLMNISKELEGFEDLILRNAKGEIHSYPDPLIYLIKDIFHTYKYIDIDSSQIREIRAIVDKIDYNNQDDIYRRMLALQYLMQRFGFPAEDIFYFTDGKKIAPAFKYDIRSFALALNEFPDADKLEMRGLDYKPDDSLITDDFGGRLAAFRFMFVKN